MSQVGQLKRFWHRNFLVLLSIFGLDWATFMGYDRGMKNMPISYMASNGKGHYLQKRIPKDLLHHYPECRSGIIKRYLHKAPASRCKSLRR
jgi:hypothetical protein